MVRSFCIFLLLVSALQSQAQSDTLVKQVAAASCDCFGDSRNTKDLSEDAFTECIAFPLMENNELVMQECLRIYGDTTEETLYKFGKAVFNKIKITLVDECDDYFILMDSLRYSALTNLNEDSLQRELKWFNSKSKAPDSSTFFTDRGILKLQLRDTSGAYYDLERAVRLKEDNIPARLFRGWALEMKKQYDKAANDFQYVADNTGDANYALLVAIVKRKRRMAEGIKK